MLHQTKIVKLLVWKIRLGAAHFYFRLLCGRFLGMGANQDYQQCRCMNPCASKRKNQKLRSERNQPTKCSYLRGYSQNHAQRHQPSTGARMNLLHPVPIQPVGNVELCAMVLGTLQSYETASPARQTNNSVSPSRRLMHWFWFGIAAQLAVDILLRMAFIDRLIRGISLTERNVVPPNY